jgi:RNase P/RNase MRP subunit p29
MQGVRALDWQLSTLGDPMADFTYLLMQWTMPGLAGADLKALNIPSMEEAAQIYCNVTGSAVPDLNWYFAYNLFRLAGITQGIAGRVRDGTAANVKAMESAKRTVPLSQDLLGIRAKGRREMRLKGATCECLALLRLPNYARRANQYLAVQPLAQKYFA